MTGPSPLTPSYPGRPVDNTDRYCIGYRYVINVTTGMWRCECGATGHGTGHPHRRGEECEPKS